jgi:adenosyl cobinamide kinase/adenosyl cobinamide phosphate guanylyltransferase
VCVCSGLSGIADQRLQKDSEYIVIKQYVDQEMQDRLFEHTRLLKERRMIAGPVEKDVVKTLKVRDKTKDQMFLVRKASKSPGRKIYI